MVSISAVMPAFNEEENLPYAAPELARVLADWASEYEIVVVNDGSRDRTGDVVRELAQSNPRVKLVEHPRNLGYGSALASGFAAAKLDWVFLTDSDRQFKVEELAGFVTDCDKADLIIGYRSPRRDPYMRRLNALGWNSLVSFLFGYVARDVDCAFKLFRRSILDVINVQSRGATFSAEFLVRSRRAGYRFIERPVTHRPRVAGSPTGAKPAVIVRAFKELIRFWLNLQSEMK